MGDEDGRARTRSVDETGHVLDQTLDRVVLHVGRAVALAVASKIRRPGAVAQAREQGELKAPGVPALGKAMQAKGQAIALAACGDMEAKAIGADLLVAEGLSDSRHNGASRRFHSPSRPPAGGQSNGVLRRAPPLARLAAGARSRP